MPAIYEIICIECPLACRVSLSVDEAGKISESVGYQCRVGKRYSEKEYKSPKRILTTVVKTSDSVRHVLPVRTDKPVPKGMLKQCVQSLADIRVKPPLKVGEIIVSNVLNTGADVICSDDLR